MHAPTQETPIVAAFALHRVLKRVFWNRGPRPIFFDPIPLQEKHMPQALTAAQRDELKALLQTHRSELLAQIAQKRENLAPPSADEGGMVQRNVAREVEQALTDIEAADIQRIDHALKTLEDGSYGLCGECGCHIPFERLKIEPQTQHCVACKSRWEQQHHKAH
ncbi:hypothetical protein GCM10027395_04800 [Giesbergeria sinuosa]